MSKRGFTLAEVLITLIVIGVISALTIPNIIQNTQDAQNKAAFKRIYSDIEQVTKRIIQDNAGSLVGLFEYSDTARDKYSQYLSFVATCDEDSVSTGTDSIGSYIISNCWSKYNFYLNKNKGTNISGWGSQAILNNGALLDFYIWDGDCTDTALYSDRVCGQIKIDVNGLKGPNQYGRDIFRIWIARKGVVPFGVQNDPSYYDKCDPNDAGTNGRGFGCPAFVLQNKDY